MKPDLKTEHALDYSKTSKELTASLSKKEKKIMEYILHLPRVLEKT